MFTTTLTGEVQIINRMQAFNKDVWSALQKDVKSAANIIGASARSMIPGRPASGWGKGGRLGWSQSTVTGSIKPKFRSRIVNSQRYVMATVNMSDAAGSLYATAGKVTSSQFSDLMNDNWGQTFPRALGPAWTMHVDEVRQAIQQAVDDAARKVAF